MNNVLILSSPLWPFTELTPGCTWFSGTEEPTIGPSIPHASHQCWVERKAHFSPGSCSPSLPQGHIAALWPTFCPLEPPGPFCWVAFQLVSLQHARAVPPQEQDLPLPLLEFHEVPFSPFLYPKQITKKSTLCTVALFWWNILRKTISEFLLFHFMYLINPRMNVNHKYIQMDPKTMQKKKNCEYSCIN